jgi:hypothetical protein
MNSHVQPVVDLSCLGYQLVAIVTTEAELNLVERWAQDESLFTVYTQQGGGHTYVWGMPAFQPGTHKPEQKPGHAPL